MKSEKEKNYERRSRKRDEFIEIFERLSTWNKLLVISKLYWLLFLQKLKEFPANWVRYQIDFEEDIREHGMPFRLKLSLQRWFNYPPYKSETYFNIQGKKIWFHSFVEEDNFELHLQYKGRFAGHIWFQPEKDKTATIIGIHIREEFRNIGLGTIAFQEAINLIKGKISCLRGVLEKEYERDIEASLRWLNRQGFETIKKENGDYELIFRID
ncbi:MAG TPA: hypothetical protein DHW49_15190 [Anaerolineae bacterium]|nr:hypothetical protein [Anaerolineae bacterium]